MDDRVAVNSQKQVELYGEPLGELFTRISHTLDLTRGRLAEVLGISAPMLSQLASGQRIKLGNPLAVQRLQALIALSEEVASEETALEELGARIDAIGSHTGTLTHAVTAPTTAVAHVHAVQTLLRSVASSTEMLEAASSLQDAHPEIAEVLRVYGAGRTDEAIAHFMRHAGQ